MKPVSEKEAQFIREQGLKKAREVVEGAPEGAEFYNNCIYVKNPHSEGDTDYFARWSDGFNAWLDAKDSRNFIDESIDLSCLKRLVESVMIITKTGGISLVKDWLEKNGNAPLHQKYLSFNGISRIYCFSTDRYGGVHARRVKQAIQEYESIYGV